MQLGWQFSEEKISTCSKSQAYRLPARGIPVAWPARSQLAPLCIPGADFPLRLRVVQAKFAELENHLSALRRRLRLGVARSRVPAWHFLCPYRGTRQGKQKHLILLVQIFQNDHRVLFVLAELPIHKG